MPSPNLTIALTQINPLMGDVLGNVRKIREAYYEADGREVDLVVFPELALTGSPLGGLAESGDLPGAVEAALEVLSNATRGRKAALLVGAPLRDGDHFFSAALVFEDGKLIGSFRRHGLPGDGASDEVRHSTRVPMRARITRILSTLHKPAEEEQFPIPVSEPVIIKGTRIGVLVGRDVWRPDAAARFKAAGAELLVSINANPFQPGILETRIRDVTALRVSETALPLVYVNLVGGQDETVLDGGSFALDAKGRRVLQMPQWEECSMDFDSSQPFEASDEVLFPVREEELYQALVLALGDYTRKSGFTDVVLGMSGGMDSAIVAAIAGDALGADHVHCIRLPSRYTSDLSNNAAEAMCTLWGFSMDTTPIGQVVEAAGGLVAPMFPTGLKQLTQENMQARARGYLLMTVSNDKNWLLLATGNKSEGSVGYGTLYGDLCGGYTPLKDVFKTTVYSLARWRNANLPQGLKGPEGVVIPVEIIDRAPSAELSPNQLDTDSLPPYPVLDAILAEILEGGTPVGQMVEKGFDPEVVDKVFRMYKQSEFKRRQASPGPRFSENGPAWTKRYPIVNRFDPSMQAKLLEMSDGGE